MSKRYSHVPPGGGADYDWSADHTYVKVSAADTGGQYTLMEDNLKAHFALGLHMHRYHAETFYILEGEVDFFVDGDWLTAGPGTCLHVPPGIEHACTLANGCTAGRMLMIYQPSGFDGYLSELAQMTEADFEDQAKMDALNHKYDIVNIGPVPERDGS
ncbi:Quercetin 2,3-dioxygenase [Shimia sp. SK013]|uniref:cupin domain-containing protein n=1 Tax=Shimia sp. SK013 TaxID=1389006 RepID=UPI0006B46FA3|nr:cupin domain-containing protein [Shimia sp. SK013]KPA21768.1 Quercetin 2,3-dioxygenase [Shimia sp. SK013]